METMATIAVMAVLIFTAIGIASVIMNLFGKSDKRKKTEKGDAFVFPGNCKFTSKPCDTPYENLWNEVGHPMRSLSFLAILTVKDDGSIRFRDRREKIYKDEILHLMNKGVLCDKGEAYSSVRKFCIEQTMSHDDPKNRIDEAEIIYRYITTGKIPNKEE